MEKKTSTEAYSRRGPCGRPWGEGVDRMWSRSSRAKAGGHKGPYPAPQPPPPLRDIPIIALG